MLAKATANQTLLPVISPPNETTSRALFASTQQQADSLARRAAEIPWNANFAPAALRALAALDSEFLVSKTTSADLLFRRAQRLVLALDRLSRAIGAPKNAELGQLFEDLRDFQPARFAERLATFRATIPLSP